MKSKVLSLALFIVSVLLLSVLPTFAQSDLDTTVVSDDETFEISYPDSWRVNANENGAISVIGFEAGTLFTVTAFSTETVQLFALGEDDALGIAENVSEAFEFVSSDAEAFTIPGRDTARAAAKVEGQAGSVFIIEMDSGDYGMVMVMALGDDEAVEDNLDFVTNIVSSYNTPATTSTDDDSDNTSDDTDGTPLVIENYGGDWEDTVAELEELGLIGAGGGLVFEEDSAFFTGQGYFFTALGRRSPHADIVMAAEIDFDSASTEFEHCSLLARLVDPGANQNVTTYFQVGIDNDGSLFYVDTEGSDETFIVDGVSLGLDLEETHHVLFLLIDETVTVYLNGELIIDKDAINEARSGTYGIALSGQDRGSRCEGNNIWVYEVQFFEEGVCEISSTGTVNRRAGPGTNFDRAGQLEAGTILQAIGYVDAADGFLWWELEDGAWVREDIVIAEGDCDNVPESENVDS